MDKILNIIERIIAMIFLVLSLPLFIIISIIIVFNLRATPIFKQLRMGKDSKPFVIYKFRTLKLGSPDNIPTDAIDDYTKYSTKFGLFLRSSSLDEIPQLLNIIKGDMSFVGPRPVMLNEVELNLRRSELGIYNVRPGITGWSQINGRDMLEIDEKIKYDLEYLQNKSIKFDIKILIWTLIKVLKKENIKSQKKEG